MAIKSAIILRPKLDKRNSIAVNIKWTKNAVHPPSHEQSAVLLMMFGATPAAAACLVCRSLYVSASFYNLVLD